MTEPRSRLRTVGSTDLARALGSALDGGPVIAPLPPDPVERRRALTVLRPDQPVTEPDAAVVVTTSGSTGRPKAAVLSGAAIRASVSATHARLGGPGDWVLALPGHYIAGLMVLARTLLARTSAWPVRSDLRDLPATVSHLTGRRYISLVPTQLSRARREDRVWEALGAFDAVLLGGGRTEAGLLAAARAAGIRVVPTYGMSETCGGCVYGGLPLDGVEVVVAEDGQILIGGEVLFSGYRLRPELTRATLVDGRLATADRGRWADGRLEVLGRRDQVVITGGLNVDLAEVEGLVRSWAGRSGGDAVVIGIPDPEWGTKIVAVTDGGGDLADLQHFVRRSVPAYAAPRALVALPELPRLTSGKPDRRAIRTLVLRGEQSSELAP
ncbi:MAG TPA: AMP-binding protein [Propionibacteriaceae bacterium]|nr:AMP-binding protein [Propionibacteriaceae bacterium]